jgi:hypothetical protein
LKNPIPYTGIGFFVFMNNKIYSSLIGIIISNIITIVLAVTQQWELHTIMILYWAESLLIGILNIFRIMGLKEFSTEGYEINGRTVSPTRGTQIQTATFFAFHFGMFHLTYMIFMFIQGYNDVIHSVGIIIINIIITTLSHIYSYFTNIKEEINSKPNIGAVMFLPYLRIIPMHLTIIVGSTLLAGSSVAFFMILKMLSDIFTHVVVHRMYRGKSK